MTYLTSVSTNQRHSESCGGLRISESYLKDSRSLRRDEDLMTKVWKSKGSSRFENVDPNMIILKWTLKERGMQELLEDLLTFQKMYSIVYVSYFAS